MNKKEIEEILEQVIAGDSDGLQRLTDEADLELACDIAHEHITPAYDHGETDLGDAWAGLLKDIKIHAINHLDKMDAMTFITNSLD